MRCAENKNRIWTIPNLLSFFRLALIPLIIWMYCSKKDYIMTAVLLGISGLTDLADGWIARNFNMITELGKALDPIADKLTQGTLLICLSSRFLHVLVLVIVFAVKEVFVGVTELLVIRKLGVVHGARWHGKLTTVIVELTLILHLVWFEIPKPVSVGLCVACIVLVLLSMVLYGIWNLRPLCQER